jgi:hypothetical protein
MRVAGVNILCGGSVSINATSVLSVQWVGATYSHPTLSRHHLSLRNPFKLFDELTCRLIYEGLAESNSLPIYLIVTELAELNPHLHGRGRY